jgi:N4-gp56 family major capsid protein
MAVTTYGDISQRTAYHAIADMLENADNVLVLSKFGKTKPVPRNKSEAVKFRRSIVYAPAIVPLAEGVTPTAHTHSYEDVPMTLKQWGDIVAITDKIEDLAEDPVLKDATEESGKQAGITLEMVTYGVLKAGSAVYYANGADRTQVNTAVSLNKLRGVIRFLKRSKAKTFTKILSSSVNYGSKSVEQSYIAVCHTDCEADIRNLAGFKAVSDYGNRSVVSEHEFGSVENIRFVTSPELDPWEGEGSGTLNNMVSVGGTNVDVYPILIFGMDAYGLCPLKGRESITPTVLNPGTPSKSDPLGQRGYVGWKAWFNAVRLNETWMARLEVGVSDID